MLKHVQTKTDLLDGDCRENRNFLRQLEGRVRAFRDEESGVLVAFGVFFILIILMIGGIGVDLMRFEFTRTSLQNTLDRAVLAAADLDQSLDPQAVVEDYFAKSSMGSYLSSVTVDQGLNYKEVSATAEIEMDTQLIHMLGINSLKAPAAGTAAESVDGVEISLVLDMSGSMGSNNRLSNLKVAAKDFVTTMINSGPVGDVSISIVPYATQVNAGELLSSYFNLTGEHDFSYCVNFSSSDYNSTSVSTSASLQQTGPFDPWYQVETNLRLPVCPERASSDIMAYSLSESALHSYIEGFSANGNTSTDIGVKWGTLLLDPAMQPVVTDLIAKGDVHNGFAGRPVAYDDDALKVMVVMSDGQNTSQYYLASNSYRTGNTDVWFYEGDYDNDGYVERVYTIKSGSTYYYKQATSWSNSYNGFTSASFINHPGTNKYYGSKPFLDGQSKRLTFPELFHQASNEYVADALYKDIWSNSYADQYWQYNAYNSVSGYTKDNRLDDICTAAKNAGIIIFTIGFEAPSHGEGVLEDCASSQAHFFDVDGIEISDAFVSIAASISKLRLVQ
ncbi:VWA domain-containing protein [Rhodobacteraceae bacterium D3-12]|nr:VWA domain-containing protein [Rhodobacteraceae bacterium D3-12]